MLPCGGSWPACCGLSLHRTMGGRGLAHSVVVRYLRQLVHTARHDCSLRRFGGNRIELYRAMALWSAYRRVTCCLDHFGDVLDLVVGPRRPGTLYSDDRVVGCHRTAC